MVDLMFEVTQILTSEGFKPEIQEDDSILFKYEGEMFIVFFDKQDPHAILLDSRIYSFDDENEENIFRLANKVNFKMKYARIFILENFVYVRADVFFIHDYTKLKDTFLRMFRAVLVTRDEFIEKVLLSKNVSLN